MRYPFQSTGRAMCSLIVIALRDFLSMITNSTKYYSFLAYFTRFRQVIDVILEYEVEY